MQLSFTGREQGRWLIRFTTGEKVTKSCADQKGQWGGVRRKRQKERRERKRETAFEEHKVLS